MTEARPVPCVGVVCLRGGEVLLIRRGKPPGLGSWSIPGGRMEVGETARAAALRELGEETGVSAEIFALIDVVDLVSEDGHLVLIDFAARWTGGEPRAGDDALEARFLPIADALACVGWSETRRIIELAAAAPDAQTPLRT